VRGDAVQPTTRPTACCTGLDAALGSGRTAAGDGDAFESAAGTAGVVLTGLTDFGGFRGDRVTLLAGEGCG